MNFEMLETQLLFLESCWSTTPRVPPDSESLLAVLGLGRAVALEGQEGGTPAPRAACSGQAGSPSRGMPAVVAFPRGKLCHVSEHLK